MNASSEARFPGLPLKLHRGVVVLDEYLGAGGMSHVFHARPANLPALIGELILAGEADPGGLGMDLPFTMGAGISDPAQARAVRELADRLWEEYLRQYEHEPEKAEANRERYLRIIDRRLVGAPRMAVKVLRRDGEDPELRRRVEERFAMENQILRKLNHENIVRRFACIEDPKLGPCLLLEHVPGETLDEIFQRRREAGKDALPLSAVARIGVQVAQALSHAHQQGVIHCDVKPANILLRGKRGSGEILKAEGVVKLGDFGISRDLDAVAGGAAGPVAGTLQYLAPERFLKHPPSPETDVYQLGTTLFVLATGRYPYDASGPEEMREQIVREGPHPVRVHHLRGEISPRLGAVIEGAREKDPKRRWPLDRIVEELARVCSAQEFSVWDVKRPSLAEELLERVETDLALRDFYRAFEGLDLVKEFLPSVPADRVAGARERYEKLFESHAAQRAAVEVVRGVRNRHIVPVDALMKELYDRYAKGKPLLTEAEKGVIRESGEEVTIVRQSLIDRILAHTSAAIRDLGPVDSELVGDMYRKMVDRASSQEEALTSLVEREIPFGEGFRKVAS